MSKYEQLIDYIINEQEEKARELFHSIVVAKSREIYESMLDDEEEEEDDEEDLEENIGGNQIESLADEVTNDEEGMEENSELGGVPGMEDDEEDSEEDEDGEEDGFGGDLTDEPEDDMGSEVDDEDESSEPATKGDVQDISTALDDLQAKFDKLLAGEEAEEEQNPDAHGGEPIAHEIAGDSMDDMDTPENDMDEMAYMESKEDKKADKKAADKKATDKKKKMTESEWLREYVDKIGDIYSQDPAKGEGKTVGTGGDEPSVNTKSTVAGKNDMGGTTANIAKGGSEQNPDNKAIPKPSNEYSKKEGKLPGADKFKNAPGKKKVWDGSADGGHGAEKKGSESGKTVGTGGDKPSLNKKGPITSTVR